MIVVAIQTVIDTENEIVTTIADAAIVATARLGAAEPLLILEHLGATQAATKVGEEVEVGMMTAVTHAETEMVITTGADGRAPEVAPDPLIATTVLATTATIATDVNVVTVVTDLLDMIEDGMTGIPSVRPLPSLLKMNGIAALYLFSSLQLVCVLGS